MKKDLISHQLVKYLEYRGVEHMFGMCGHTNIAVLTALEGSKIRFVNCRHEQIAAHAVDGYARAGKRTGVLLTHIGPGLTNATTGVATAALDSIPMVVISGDAPGHYHGRNAFQEVNMHADASQWEIFRPFVKRSWRVDRPHLFPEIIDKAFKTAESGRPGPVLVSVPMDIFSKEIDVALFERVMNNCPAPAKPTIDNDTAVRIIDALASAKRPVFYVGGGAMRADAADELKALVDHLEIPVAHSQIAKGILPDDHPLTLGLTGFWGTRFVNEKCRTADLVLALGTRFMESDVSSWEPEFTFDMSQTRLMQVDIDPTEIGRYYPVEIGAVADLKCALSVLNRVARQRFPDGLKNEKLKAEIADYRAGFIAANATKMASDVYPMQPERILADIREVLPRDAFITTDTGWSKNGVAQQFPVYTPGSILTPGGFATMGFGSPAVLGVKLACPDRVAVSLAGDGAFGQNPIVLANAVEENIPVIWIVLNNCSYGTIAGLQKHHYGTTVGTLFQVDGKPYSPDFAAMAETCGALGIKVNSAAEFKPALERAVASKRPCLVEVMMSNDPVQTDGHWNINDIYSRNPTRGFNFD